MRYNKYRKGLKAIRRLLYTDNVRMIDHMGRVRLSGRNGGGGFNVIWNAKTNNVVAAVNARGVVFVRDTSVYAGQLLNSQKHRVVSSANMERFRPRVPASLRLDITMNMLCNELVERIRANNDEPGVVVFAKVRREDNLDVSWLSSMALDKMGFSIKEFPNTVRTLRSGSFNVAHREDQVRGMRTFSFEVKDFSEEIAKEEAENAIKRSIVQYCADNYDKLVEDGFVNRANNLSNFSVRLEHEGKVYEATMDGGRIRQLHEGIRELDNCLGFQLREVPEDEHSDESLQHLMNTMQRYSYSQYNQAQRFTVNYATGTTEHFYGTPTTTSAAITAADIVAATEAMSAAEPVDLWEGASVLEEIARHEYPTPDPAMEMRPPSIMWTDNDGTDSIPG